MNNEVSIVFGKKYNTLECLIHKLIENQYRTKNYEIFPYVNYAFFKQVFAKSYPRNSTIEYINVWQYLYIDNPLRVVDEILQDMNEFIVDMNSRNNVLFIIENEEKLKESFKNFSFFNDNFKKILSSIDLKTLFQSKNKNYFISSLSSTLYFAFLQIKHNVFTQKPHLDTFKDYLSFFADNDIFIISNQNSSKLFLKITELFCVVYDTSN